MKSIIAWLTVIGDSSVSSAVCQNKSEDESWIGYPFSLYYSFKDDWLGQRNGLIPMSGEN